MEKMIMNITKINENNTLLILLEGKLDTTSAPNLQEKLSAIFNAEPTDIQSGTIKEVHLDCSKLSYISSAGLRVLLIVEKLSKTAGISFILKGVSEDIMEVFSMTGFDKLLKIFGINETPHR